MNEIVAKSPKELKKETEAKGKPIAARGAWAATANNLVERSQYVFLTKEELLLAIYCHLEERREMRGVGGGMLEEYYSLSEDALRTEFERFFSYILLNSENK